MDTNKTQSIMRALSILNTFSEKEPYQKTSEIAKKTGLNMSTVSRQLGTLLDMGFVERDDYTGFYGIGPQILVLAGVYTYNSDLYRLSLPELYELSQATKLNTFLGARNNDTMIHLANIGTTSLSDLFIPIGHVYPLYSTARARVILANIDSDTQSRVIRQASKDPLATEWITNTTKLHVELNKIEKQGYCIINGEISLGKVSIAAPIFNRQRSVIGAISVSGYNRDMDFESNETKLAHQVMSIAAKISGKLGYFPN